MSDTVWDMTEEEEVVEEGGGCKSVDLPSNVGPFDGCSLSFSVLTAEALDTV